MRRQCRTKSVCQSEEGVCMILRERNTVLLQEKIRDVLPHAGVAMSAREKQKKICKK